MGASQQSLISSSASVVSGTIALVSSASASSNQVTAHTSTIDTSGATLLIASIAQDQSVAAFAPTDFYTNTWVQLTTQATTSGARITIWYVKNPTVGTGHDFTASAGGSFNSIIVAAFNKTDRTQNVDQQTGTFSNAAASLATGSITPSAANELVVTAMGGATATSSVDSGFTQIVNLPLVASNAYQNSLAYKVQTTAAAVNPIWTPASSSALAVTQGSFKHG